ncbi:MAG: hypothetical protein ACI9OE_002108 [Mariniflexile sp.]|jgi:hypothetical protein
MIICGDFAYPFQDNIDFLSDVPDTFLKKIKIVNFESTLDSLNQQKLASGIAISSSDLSLCVLNDLNVKGVCLANNHILDFEYDENTFLSRFKDKGIKHSGMGSDLKKAAEPIFINEYIILNFGWETIGCKPAKDNGKGCNPLKFEHVLTKSTDYINRFENSKIVVVFHWNYEFELYPQPAHRKLAKKLIDLGVDCVIGHHSHIIQGAELYKGKAIIYGLGNFYLPKFNYSGYYLDFPDIAYTGLAVDISNLDSYLVYSHDNKLRVSEPIPLFENEEVMKVSQFAEMNDAEYLKFFKKKRVKRKLLPIYKSWGRQTVLNDKFVQLRQIFIDTLVRLNLKKHRK